LLPGCRRPRRRRTGSAVATDGRRDGATERTGVEWRRATASTRQRERLSGTAGGVDGELPKLAAASGGKMRCWAGALG